MMHLKRAEDLLNDGIVSNEEQTLWLAWFKKWGRFLLASSVLMHYEIMRQFECWLAIAVFIHWRPCLSVIYSTLMSCKRIYDLVLLR